MLGVAEVDVAHQVQRLVVVGVESEVLQQQVGAYHAQGVVVEAHSHAVGDAHQIGRVYVHLAVYQWVAGGALDAEAALAVAFQADDLVGYEAVDERQRQPCHVEAGVDVSFTFIIIGATQQSELLLVEHQAGLDGVGVALLLQVYQLGADVAYGRALVGHALHAHVGGHGEALLLVLQYVEVAIQIACDARHIGQHRGQLVQIDAVER